MSEPPGTGFWSRLPVTPRAIISGLVVGLGAANVWPVLLRSCGLPVAAICEVAFLGLYLAWARGAFPPKSTSAARRWAARDLPLTAEQWAWGLPAALAIAVAVHAAMVVLFRLTPFPATAFHRGYDFAAISGLPLQWLACVISALSAGVCEEVGFRGYMQRPIERRHGPIVAIAVSSVLFMLLHLNKDWSVVGMTPIVLGAGVLFGLLAWSSRSLVFCILGHWTMDIGLFAYWWTQIAGVFREQTIWRTGIDAAFLAAVLVFIAAVAFVLIAAVRLRRLGQALDA